MKHAATPAPPTSSSWMLVAPIALALVLYGGTFASVFRQLAGQWSKDPNYSHGFLVPVISAYLIWDARHRLAKLSIAQDSLGVVLVLIGLTMLLLGTLGAELFLQNAATVVVFAGLVWTFLGRATLRALAFPLAFLLFYVPLPALILNQIAFPLQLFAAKCAVGTLGIAGVPVLREGNIIELADTTLEVAEACSGIRSLQALIALSTVFAYVAQKTLSRRVVLVLCSIPIAVIVNALRVSGTGLIAHYYGADKAEGFYHGFTSWLVFLVALALLVAANAALTRLDGARRVRAPLNPRSKPHGAQEDGEDRP